MVTMKKIILLLFLTVSCTSVSQTYTKKTPEPKIINSIEDKKESIKIITENITGISPTPSLPTDKNVYELPLRYTITNECDLSDTITVFAIEEDGSFYYRPTKGMQSPPLMSRREGYRKLTETEINTIYNFLNNLNLENQAKQITKLPDSFSRPAGCMDVPTIAVRVNNSEKNFSYNDFEEHYPTAYVETINQAWPLLKKMKDINPGNHSYNYDIPLEINSYKICGTGNSSAESKYLFELTENGKLYYNFIDDYGQHHGVYNYPFVQLSEKELIAVKDFFSKLNIAAEGEKLTELSETEINENLNNCGRIEDSFYFRLNGRQITYSLGNRRFREPESYKKVLGDLKSYLTKLVNEKLE
jgi:hypothetical protein